LLALVVFGSLTSLKEVAMVLLKVEVSLLQASKVFSPLEWRLEHEKQFLYLGSFARQVIGIMGS
jgi:hypothetical protein